MTQYVFTYANNRYAMKGQQEITEKQAYDMAARLSADKKRVIVLKRLRYIYETERYHHNYSGLDMPIDHEYVPIAYFKNGKLDRRV